VCCAGIWQEARCNQQHGLMQETIIVGDSCKNPTVPAHCNKNFCKVNHRGRGCQTKFKPTKKETVYALFGWPMNTFSIAPIPMSMGMAKMHIESCGQKKFPLKAKKHLPQIEISA